MTSLALSACFALAVILIAFWVLVVVNRAPPPPRLSLGRYAGRDSDAFIKGWKRKLQRVTRRASS